MIITIFRDHYFGETGSLAQVAHNVQDRMGYYDAQCHCYASATLLDLRIVLFRALCARTSSNGRQIVRAHKMFVRHSNFVNSTELTEIACFSTR